MLSSILFWIGTIIYSLFGGIVNHWRGGFKPPILRHIPGSRYWTVAYYTIPIAIFMPWTWWLILYILVWYIVTWDGVRRGWGSYFDMGTYEHGWKADREVGWIDWFLYKTFGPMWIPNHWNSVVSVEQLEELKKRYDLRMSPTGDVRPYSWRVSRDFVGMGLRGLHYTIPWAAMLAVAVYLGWLDGWWRVYLLAPLGLCMAPLYWVNYQIDSEKWFWSRAEVTWGMFTSLILILAVGLNL